MTQDYSAYTQEDHSVWQILFDRQVKNLKDKASPVYFECLENFQSGLSGRAIPKFDELRALLGDVTGWGLEVVPGLIPVSDFFALLADKKFCSSTWVRSREMLDYLEEPDMFHDVFGHTPLLLNESYADFMHAFGKLGVHYKESESAVLMLQRLYWFTIEFGLIRAEGRTEIYGAGIVSSFGETNHIFEDDIEVVDFDLDRVMNNAFINSEIQTRYYSIEDVERLFQLIEETPRYLEDRHRSIYL